MKDMVKIGSRLAIICAVAALVLGLMNAVTEPRIELIKQQRLAAALENVSSGMKVGEANPVEGHKGITTYYPLFESSDTSDDPDAYIVRLVGTGYGGDMVILAGFQATGEVFAVQLMENQETPGLGKEAEKSSYMEMYLGTGGEEPIPVRKDMLAQEEADTITGATITFIGIAKALENGSNFVKELGGI
ncbi:MAG TPA: FMN-binding protein [Sediminispirochaeta sp.]|nr:FMN-binding protein [Sediminispirochaeta sp.]